MHTKTGRKKKFGKNIIGRPLDNQNLFCLSTTLLLRRYTKRHSTTQLARHDTTRHETTTTLLPQVCVANQTIFWRVLLLVYVKFYKIQSTLQTRF